MSELNNTENIAIVDKDIVTEDAVSSIAEDKEVSSIELVDLSSNIEPEGIIATSEADADVVPTAEPAEDVVLTVEASAIEETPAPAAESESKSTAFENTKEALGSVYDKIKVAAISSEEKIKGWFSKTSEKHEDKE